ncbi:MULTISPECIES: hypothetical protein [Paraburkholderia]|jgi:hypothetical protein|uniref:Uncharacterized protein n=1 Tax=Paraburkholderia metrosideri TaxID=580937 RepID=A0ABW9DPD3_9BURK
MLINGFIIDASRRGGKVPAEADGSVAGAMAEALSMSATRAVFISIRFPFVIPGSMEGDAAVMPGKELCKPEYKAIFAFRLP